MYHEKQSSPLTALGFGPNSLKESSRRRVQSRYRILQGVADCVRGGEGNPPEAIGSLHRTGWRNDQFAIRGDAESKSIVMIEEHLQGFEQSHTVQLQGRLQQRRLVKSFPRPIQSEKATDDWSGGERTVSPDFLIKGRS
jgi:hypothetical protein